MRVGGEVWDLDVEARLARATPSNFAQAGGRRATSCAIGLNSAVDYLILPRISSVWAVPRAAGKKPSTIKCANPCTRPHAAMAA
jgi:hypothetical protein